MATFAPASREKTFLKLCLAGPAGSGKSFTALRVAHAMLAAGLGKRIGIIESEAGKIKLYCGYVVDDHPWGRLEAGKRVFDLAQLTSYSPQEYIATIDNAVRAGFDIILIDSISHEWQGAGGVLEIVDKVNDRNKFAGWKQGTPLHTQFVETILHAPAHVICTCRLRMDYVLTEVQKDGKTVKVPQKVGLAPVQRNDLEYEFQIFCTMDHSHILRVEKTICPAIDGKTCVEPGESFFRPVFDWLTTGEEIRVDGYRSFTVPPEELAAVAARLAAARVPMEPEREWCLKTFGVRELGHLSREQFQRYQARAEMVIRNATGGAGAPRSAAAQQPPPAPPAASPKPADQVPPTSEPPPVNGHAATAAAGPGRALSGDPRTDCRTLWEEYCFLSGWARDDSDSAWRGILAKFGVGRGGDLTADQLGQIIDRLKGAVKQLHAERGTPEAMPF